MARKPTIQQLLAELQDRYGSEVALAFFEAVEDWKSAADIQEFVVALSVGDIERAIAALHLDAETLDRILDAAQSGYVAAGDATAASIPAGKAGGGARVVIRFSARNPRAEAWLRESSSSLVTRIVEDQKVAVRSALVDGMERGVAPRSIGLDIVGRIDRATGKRVGGIVGLSAPQEEYVRAARAELASGSPADLRKYLTRTRRDKRFDRSVQKALRDNTPIPADIARKAVTRYQARLLELRGQTIGRTEAMTSIQAAKHEAHLQAVESGGVQEGAIRRVWRSAGDGRVRHTHAGLNGDTAGLQEPFTSPSGTRLMFPGDPSAPAAERIGCRCDLSYRIDFLSNLR